MQSLATSPAARRAPPPDAPQPSVQVRLNRLVDEYLPFVWRSMRRLGVPRSSVDDGVQQVFVVAASKIELIEVGRERSFLFGTALRISKKLRHGSVRQREVHDEEAVLERADGSRGPEELLDELNRRRLLDDILEQMPDALRTVFVMFELEEFTSVEIAGTLGVPVGTVASRLRRAREQFHNEAARIRARYHGSPEGT